MRLGLQIPRFTWPSAPDSIRSTLRQIAVAAEAAGFDSLWVMDHFFQIPAVGRPAEPMLEAYTTLGTLAGMTERVQLGALVTGVIYRQPALLVKEVTSLDVLSGGRAYFGIGAAWFERESKGLGVAFPSTAERFERLEEALQITHQMWSGEVGPYHGRHFQLAETLCQPMPISRPHPPIMIGGMGERKTLRMVAEYGDACNLFARQGAEVVQHKLEVLAEHCHRLDRPYDQIEKTTLATADLSEGKLTPQGLVDWCGQLSELGIDHAIFNLPNVHEIEPLDRIGAEVIPHVHRL
jgi:F420-dependent oxidoreductase-like protein